MTTGTHIAFDSFATERLSQLGFNVVRASDNLLIGPSRRDPLEHAQARAAWWGDGEWDHLYSPDVRWESPVIVWVSASICQKVNLWRTCAWLRRIGAANPRTIELDAMPPRRAPEEPRRFDCTSSVGEYADEALLKRARAARPWPMSRQNRAIELWNQFTDADPSHFVDRCIRGVRGFPELRSLWAFLSQLVPKTTPGGVLHLSRFDELLLFILSEKWQTAVDVFVHKSQLGVELREIGSCTGDLFIPQRLDEWVGVGAAERGPGPKSPDDPMLGSAYRITEKGIRLRDKGLEALADAPTLPIGGTEAYGAPWVLHEDGRLVQGGT